MAYPIDTVPEYNTSYKGHPQVCRNYRIIALFSHLSKVMLRVTLNRLKPQAEEIIPEEQD